MAETIQFDGPCPYLTCLKTIPHSHPICPVCGAVRYGNLYCEECKKHRAERDQEVEEMLKILHAGERGKG